MCWTSPCNHYSFTVASKRSYVSQNCLPRWWRVHAVNHQLCITWLALEVLITPGFPGYIRLSDNQDAVEFYTQGCQRKYQSQCKTRSIQYVLRKGSAYWSMQYIHYWCLSEAPPGIWYILEKASIIISIGLHGLSDREISPYSGLGIIK